MKYKGKYIMTISSKDVSNFAARKMNPNLFFKLKETMGELQNCDIGKQVYEINGIYQVENDEQLRNRLLREKK